MAAEEAIEVAQVDIVEAQKDIEDARVAVVDAQKDVEDAQDDLDEALTTSLEITAPFDGFITRVNVEGGDEVMKGTVAVQIADPNKFEADVLVSEMDILQIKLGGEATVEVDAMAGMSLPAEVTHIAPTATIQAGVVNYEVKVEIKSLEAVHQEQRQQAMQSIAAGELPPRLQQGNGGDGTQQESHRAYRFRDGSGHLLHGEDSEIIIHAGTEPVPLAEQPGYFIRDVTRLLFVSNRQRDAAYHAVALAGPLLGNHLPHSR
ncbi:hypothetical protein ES703_82640 [subsurface metagenome]